MDDKITEISDQKNERSRDPFTVFVIILIALLLILIIYGAVSSSMESKRYDKIKTLMASGDYKQAGELLKKTNYRDTSGLKLLCEAHLEYEGGSLSLARKNLYEAKSWYKAYSYYNYTPPEDFDAFMDLIDKKQSEARAAAAERERQALEYQIKNGVPFEGMPESRIGDTVLGKPSDNVEKRRRWQYINSNLRVEYYEYVYSFYNKNGYLVFEAVCVGGNVRRVNDYRKNPVAPFDPSKYIGKIYDNSPSVDGFSNPEDFYDWYYDDFFDYYEAEDYYYSHGGS